MIVAILMLGCLSPGCATVRMPWGNDAYFGPPARTTRQAQAYAWHLTGILHDRRNENAQAQAAWERVIRLDQDAVAPRLALVRAHLKQGDPEQALAMCGEALQHAPDMAELWVVQGELNHRLGRVEEAIAAFKKAIALRPDDLLGYGALVELQESTNDLVAAIDIYQRLIESSPDSAALHYQLGINLARIQDNESARRSFETVLELEPRITRARFLLALSLFELGQYEQSAEQAQRYLQERPDDADALEYLAGALARGGRIEEGRAALEKIVGSNAAVPKNYVQLAWLLMLEGKTERAQQYALEGGAYLLADMIFTCAQLERAGKDAHTETPWDDRFTLDEIDAETDLWLISVQRLFGQTLGADKMLGMLIQLSGAVSFSPSLSLFHARLLLEQEQPNEALDKLNQITANGLVSKVVHYYSAMAYDKLNDFPNTEAQLRAYLALSPDDPDILNFLGYLYAENKVNLDEAEQLLQRALKLDPENPFYLDSLGWIYYQQGRAEEAAALIRRAIYGMDTDDAELRHHLGDIYLLQGNLPRALEEWNRALRLDPSLDAIRQKIEQHQGNQEK